MSPQEPIPQASAAVVKRPAVVSQNQRDQRDPQSAGDERAEGHVREPLRQGQRSEHGQEQRCQVEGDDRQRDRAELDRLEEEQPVGALDDPQNDDRADNLLPGCRVAARPPEKRYEGESSGREREPEECERPGAEIDGRDENGDESPGRREPGEGEIPAHRTMLRACPSYMWSGASTPIRSRLRATTDFVAVQRPRRNDSDSEPSTLCW